MKTPRRSITFFSFFPVTVLLATPLMFSTLAPASTDDYMAPIDSSEWVVPQSQLVLEEFLRAQEVRNGEIEEVKFLQYSDDYIYRASGGGDATALDDSRNTPFLTDKGEIDTAYVLQNPEFQRQVEEVSAQASQAGATMPSLLTLVALFAFAIATGTSSLKDFFKFSTYTDKVKKTIQVTKKVAKTVYRTITETVARKVKMVKQVAYTAYKTNVVQVISPPSVDKLEEMARFMRKSVKENPSFSRPFERNARYYLPNMKGRSEWDNFTIEYGGIAAGTRVGGTVHRLKEYFSSPAHTDVKMSLDTISDYFFEGIRFTEPALYEKLKEEFDAIVQPVIKPVVDLTGTPYTAYRDEIETKTVYDTISREVPETIYEDVTEDREITEDVTKYSFTPLNEKIDLAMGYLKNYQRILQSPSNRNFSDSVLVPNRDLSLFAGAATVYNSLQAELKNANVYNMDRTDPEGVKEILKRHNEFIYSMKGILTKIQKGKTPEEQMTLLFGKDYADSVIANENAIAQIEADEKALTARFNEIEELLRTNKISTGYYRSLYSSAKRNRDQLYRRQRDAEKNLKKAKESYASRFNGTVPSLQNLSFLRSLEDWKRTLDYGQHSVSSRLVPFTTANGSVVYRKPATTTTTVAQPKKTILQPTPANLTTTSPADLQTSGLRLRDWMKNLFGKKDTAKTTKTAMLARNMATITTDNLNVRTGPDISYARIAKLNVGDQVEVIGKTKDEKWLNVKLANGTTAWIINNDDWVKVPSLKNIEVVTVTERQVNSETAEPVMLQDTKITPMRIPELEKGPISKKVDGIVLHRTASTSAQSTLNSFKKGVGTHFVVAKDGEIYQTASLSQYTYHIGKIKSECYVSGDCTTEEMERIQGYGWNPTAVHKNEYTKDSSKRYPINEDGIGIEVVGQYYKEDGKWEPLTTEQISSVTYLVSLLQSKYNLSFSDLYAHEAISHKTEGEGQTVLDAIKGQIKKSIK